MIKGIISITGLSVFSLLFVAMVYGQAVKSQMQLCLKGKNVAIFVDNLYEDPELLYPYYRLLEAGATVQIVRQKATTYMSKHNYPAKADVAISDVNADDFDGVVVPGGFAPDRMRRN